MIIRNEFPYHIITKIYIRYHPGLLLIIPGLVVDGKELVWAVGKGTGIVEDTEFEDDNCFEEFWITLGTLDWSS